MSSKIRLYFSSIIKSELVSHLTREQSYYIKSVMRLNPGDVFSVFNSQGEWNVKIENYQKKIANIRILKKVRDKENEKDTWLAFSPIKQNPLNFMIQKTTELGIQKFIPILSERSIVKEINTGRLKKIIIEAANEMALNAVSDILKNRSINRGLSIKIYEFLTIENATGMSVRQIVNLKEGISKENATKINKMIKGMKLKVQSQIQGEQIRVTGKKIDDLQSIITFLKKENLDIPLQFINMKK